MTRRLTTLLVLLAGLATALLAGPAEPAAAHNVLVGSTPAEGSTGAAPSALTLRFDDVVLDRLTAVVLTGPAGTVGLGTPQVRDREVTVAVPAVPTTGAYTVAYRVVSADGHPVQGEIRFTVTSGASAPAGGTDDRSAQLGPAPSLADNGSGAQASRDAGGGSAVPFLVGGGVAGLAVVLVLGAVLSRHRRG